MRDKPPALPPRLPRISNLSAPPAWRAADTPPLSQTDMARIHEAALCALEEIGLADAPPSGGVEIMTGAGAVFGRTGACGFRVRWSRTCWPLPPKRLCCMAARQSMT